jgi:hypothetical protein
LDVCDGVTYELLQEIKSKRPPVKVRERLEKYFHIEMNIFSHLLMKRQIIFLHHGRESKK